MPGIDMSHQEHQEYYETLLKQYNHEKELLKNYQEMCTFDISRLEKGPTENFLNNRSEGEPTISPASGDEPSRKLDNFPASDQTTKFNDNQILETRAPIKDETSVMEFESYSANNLNPRSNF